MYKFLKNLSCLLCLIVIFGSCRKKAFDDYYGRPSNLQPPIYQVLQGRGNFNTFLAVIDKSGYKATLSAAGYWTLFAPNDAAFQKYFTANNTSLDKIDSVTARKIVTYSLVFNAFQTDHIADYQSAKGWVPTSAFKRRTAYYDGFMFGAGPDGANGVYVSENRNVGVYQYGDNNNKYIPYFYSTFMTAAGLSAADYNYFFPSSTYSGFNVANASVVNKDILAENGVIHEIDQVVLPLPSVEQKMASNSQYSVFKSIFDQFMVTYASDVNYTRQYNTVTNKNNTVYVKKYAPNLTFAPGNENFVKLEDNDGQRDGYTLFAPTDAALIPYIDNTILEFYVPDATQRTPAKLLTNMAVLPTNIIADLLNAHMFPTTVWPSKFASAGNANGEPPRFNTTTDIVEKQFGSNGLFYGVNKVQQANVFSTVYARAYLDPNYSIMTRLLDLYAKAQTSSPSLKYTVFMLSDAQLRALGYDFNTASQAFTQTVNGTTTSGGTPQAALQRILNINIVPTPNGELDDLSGNGIAESLGGEYIRWNNNKVSSAGTVEQNLTLNVIGSRSYSNGKVYYLSGGILDQASKLIAADIAANAGTSTAQGPYYDFYTYMVSSGAYNAGAGELLNVQLGANYTVFIPTQAAMKQAVIDGYLPGVTAGSGAAKTFVSFTYNPSSSTDKDLVTRFIQYHILNGISIAPDGKKGVNGVTFPTLLKNVAGDALSVVTFNQPGNLTIRDSQARTIGLVAPNNNSYFPATSNYLGNRVLLHQIDGYLRYTL
ncbi:fasciclin domain-containing protein [Mucilaginibacter mali]|uniref:Fasciclin domain-containing protein n=1 Tax=Mucilaginibacter mali TaxID=2740462 RepID=A0A7D4UAA0_9SPHI|nr:fasciclin domain-containing protein [Mucilaginibacter mali]QKJ29758.1 fasciclin domain-containing protein [Mucilaginibacter mali]